MMMSARHLTRAMSLMVISKEDQQEPPCLQILILLVSGSRQTRQQEQEQLEVVIDLARAAVTQIAANLLLTMRLALELQEELKKHQGPSTLLKSSKI